MRLKLVRNSGFFLLPVVSFITFYSQGMRSKSYSRLTNCDDSIILFTEHTRLRRKILAVNITAHMFKIVLCYISPFTRYFVLID